MRVAVLGAAGGLGRHVVDAALARGHEVRALVRDPARAALPAGVRPVAGDAADPATVRAIADVDAVFFCVNPPFSDWLSAFPPLLDAALGAVRATGARLVFPGNVWIYGRAPDGRPVDEGTPPAPCSDRGRLRAALEARLFEGPGDVRLVRLPEFYGPGVVTLTARLVRAVLAGRRVLWPGPVDRPLELVYLPDAADVMVRVSELPAAPPRLHLPGPRTTAAGLAAQVAACAEGTARVSEVPDALLAVAGWFDGAARGVRDIRHLLTHPILLDGRRLGEVLGAPPPSTGLAEGVARTVAWHRAHPDLRLQG